MSETDQSSTLSTPPSFITLRAPTKAAGGTSTSSSSSTTFKAPPASWLMGTWHVTHSTLPMWKKARNVSITYKTLSSDSDPRLDDQVTYQGLSSNKVNTISGIDTPAGPGAWNWRGRGWLMIVSSLWELLGYGGEGEEMGNDMNGEQWVVTYFAKTLFTRSGIDIYSRRKEGLKQETVEAIKEALGRLDSEVVRSLLGQIFEVKSD
ncbi:unnamed protein product [Calypogeia fissa]